MTYYDPWPLERRRKFESKYFTEEELWAKCQENGWLKTGGYEFELGNGMIGPWGDKHDYVFSAYECYSLLELKNAFLYGNWSIRACFTYKDLAFINQVNAGDEWWALKKQKDGTLQEFDSITMCAVINHTEKRFITTYHSGERFTFSTEVQREAERLTEIFQASFGEIGRFITGSRYEEREFDIFFEYIDHSYFRNYINELLEATVLRWWGYREIDGVRVE